MVIEEEIARAIKGSANSNKKLDRNIEMILYYYGFGEIGWPTLQNIADKFNIGTRERVRQIINSMFRDRFSIEDFDFLINISNIIQSDEHAYIQAEMVVKKLSEVGYLLVKDKTKSIPSLRGLFNMLHDMGLCLDYAICNRDLTPISRNSLNSISISDTYIINTKIINKLQKIVSKARSVPSKVGMILLTDMEKELSSMFRKIKAQEFERSVLMNIIKECPESLFIMHNGEPYYAMDKKNNTINSNARKALFVTQKINLDRLATAILGALRERGAKYPYPSEKVIQKYLKASANFEINKNNVSYSGLNDTELSPIEKDIVSFFKSKNGKDVKFLEAKTHLLSLGYSSPHIVKSVSNSSIVFVDRMKGRGRYTYHLI